MYSGTALSINTYFAELAKRTGLCNVWDVASRAGVTAAGGGDGYEGGDAPIDSTACRSPRESSADRSACRH